MDFAGRTGESLPYPIIADPTRDIATRLGMLDPAEKDKAGLPLTARCVSGIVAPVIGSSSSRRVIMTLSAFSSSHSSLCQKCTTDLSTIDIQPKPWVRGSAIRKTKFFDLCQLSLSLPKCEAQYTQPSTLMAVPY